MAQVFHTNMLNALVQHMKGMYLMESSNPVEYADGCNHIIEANKALKSLTCGAVPLLADHPSLGHQAAPALQPDYMIPISVLLHIHHEAFTLDNDSDCITVIEAVMARFLPQLKELGGMVAEAMTCTATRLWIEASLEDFRGRKNPEWYYLFSTPTETGGLLTHLRSYDDSIRLATEKLIGTHVSEEASEVVKEVCKNERNMRTTSKALISELADMQAMINLAMEGQSTDMIKLFELQARCAENKKRLVIAAEVEQNTGEAVVFMKLREKAQA